WRRWGTGTPCASLGRRRSWASSGRTRWCSSLRDSRSDLGHVPVRLGAAITIELPRLAHLLDHLEVGHADDELVLVLAGGADEVAARVDEVARSVEFADVPRRLGPDAVRRRDEVPVGHRVRRLLELPEVLRQTGDGRRRIEDDLRAVQPEEARAL